MWLELRTDLPNLQSVKLGNYAFRSNETFAMSNLTSLQSVEFGQGCFGGASSFSLIGIVEWMKWIADLPQLQSVKLGNGAFQNTGSFGMSNLTSLQSIDIGGSSFNRASSFSLIGNVEWTKWIQDLPQLQSVKLDGSAFQYTKSFTMSNLPSIQSIDIGSNCFGGEWPWGGASSFSLIDMIEWTKWWVDLPQLQSVKLGGGAFYYTGSFGMSNLTSLQSIDIGGDCFRGASSFSLIGIVEWMKWIADLPQLQSVKLGDYAFHGTKSFGMSNLTSLQSIEFGQLCFYWASSFSLIGIVEWMKWWVDLPQLQSVKLGNGAFQNTGSFGMSNLTSLQSIEFGSDCFRGYYNDKIQKYEGGASSFSLIGIVE